MLKVVSCPSTPVGHRIISLTGSEVPCKFTRFSDGELEVQFLESVRGDDVYIIQSLSSDSAIMELLLTIQAARLASAHSVVAVCPYMGYLRQDRKSAPRVSIGAQLLFDLIQVAGASKIITMDMHNAAEQGFTHLPVDHLHASFMFKELIPASTLVAPDAGAAKRVEKYAMALQLPMVTCYKQRTSPNQVAHMEILGDVTNKDCVIIDDMVDTGSSLLKCAELLKSHGASRVFVFFTHSVLSKGPDVLRSPFIDEIITTDSLTPPPFANVCSCATLFANAILNSYNNLSIEQLYNL